MASIRIFAGVGIVVLCVVAAGAFAWHRVGLVQAPVNNEAATLPEIPTLDAACNSCDARHQRLKKKPKAPALEQ